MAYLYLAEKLKKRYPSLTQGVDWDVAATSGNASVSIIWRAQGIPAPDKDDIESRYTDAQIIAERQAAIKDNCANNLSTEIGAVLSVLEVRMGLAPNTLANEVRAELRK